MTASSSHSGRWSRRRWATTVGVILAGQLLLVFLLSERPKAPAGRATGGSVFRLVTDPAARQRLAEEPWLGDPAELALASPLGFSGPVWLRLPKPSPQVQEWSEPPRWLTQDISGLGASFASVPGLAAWPSPPVAERPAPAYAGLPWQTNSSFTNSHLRVEALAGRPLLSEFSLPKWPFGDVLAPSTVQVLVSTQGTVMSATLLAGSGLAAADQRALELARSARFAPAPTAGLAWGRLVFEWHTQPEGAALPAPPASR